MASRAASPGRSASDGNPDHDLGEAVIEILAESPRSDHLLQILVGRADDPGVDRDRLAAADPLDHPLLQEAQQFHLQRQRDVADLVEEQGAAMGHLDLALGGLDRPGEGALFIAEQLRLEQILRNGRAVDRDEAAHPPPARLVDAARQQFLAGAGSPEQHHRDVGIGDPLDRARDPGHFGRGSNHGAEHPALVADLLLQTLVLVLEPVQLEGAADDQPQLIDVHRLLVEIIGAGCDCPERAFPGAMARGDDHLGLRLQREDRLQRRKALGDAIRIGRQAKIQRDDRRLGRAEQVDRRVAVRGDQHLIIVIGPAELTLQPLVVLDDQQTRLHGLDDSGGIHARFRSMA